MNETAPITRPQCKALMKAFKALLLFFSFFLTVNSFSPTQTQRSLKDGPRTFQNIGHCGRDHHRSGRLRLKNSLGQSNNNNEQLATDIQQQQDDRQIPAPVNRPDLPELTADEERQLRAGERIQRQNRVGKKGDGFACVDVRASLETVWATLTDYRRYPGRISTIRDAIVFSSSPQATKAEFMISRFRFPVRAVMRYEPEASRLAFDLDPDCKVPPGVFKSAAGFWFAEPAPGREATHTRVWIAGAVEVNRAVPGFVVDLGAQKALPKSSNWVKPVMEAEERRRQAAARRR